MQPLLRTMALGSVLCIVAGCETIGLESDLVPSIGFQQVQGTEVALKFRKIPRLIGGGIGSEVISPGGKVLVWPWEELIRLTNTQRTESWGTGEGAHRPLAARSSDGNEVAFDVTVIYQISRDPAELRDLVTSVAHTDEQIRELVVSQVRALVRQFANRLATRKFVSSDLSSELRRVEKEVPTPGNLPRNPATDEAGTFDSVKRELEVTLEQALRGYRLELIQLSVANPRFVRYREGDEGAGEQVDDTYQTMLVNVQREQQAIKRESESRKTQEERKYGEKEIALKEASKVISAAEAEGERIGEEARFMLETKQIEKEAITKSGSDMLASMRAQIEAVAGKGGDALLRLDIARELTAGNASFIVLNTDTGSATGGSPGSVDVRKTDTNRLIQQLGLIEAMRAEKRTGISGKNDAERGAQDEIKGADALVTSDVTPSPGTALRAVPFARTGDEKVKPSGRRG